MLQAAHATEKDRLSKADKISSTMFTHFTTFHATVQKLEMVLTTL